MDALLDTPVEECEPSLCALCNKDLCGGPMGHCSHCGICWCPECDSPDMREFECEGRNHYFPGRCCSRCVPKYGKIIGKEVYICPSCAATGADTAEYRFKVAAYMYNERILRRDHIATGLTDEYLNDPKNWDRFTENRSEVEAEWENLMTYRKRRTIGDKTFNTDAAPEDNPAALPGRVCL